MSFIKRVGGAFSASYVELTQKVSWPSSSELTNSAVVVMVASLIIALVVLGRAKTFETHREFVYRSIGAERGVEIRPPHD